MKAINLPYWVFYICNKCKEFKVASKFDTSDSEMMWIFLKKMVIQNMVNMTVNLKTSNINNLRVTVDYQRILF